MVHKKYKLIWLLIAFSFLGTQCSPGSPVNDSTITPQSSLFSVSPIPHTKTATLPATPTRTARPTWTPRSTSVATLPPDQVQSLLIELVETNGGCVYPCWWGIMPGETSWVSTQGFLQPLAINTFYSGKGYYFSLMFPNNDGDSTRDFSVNFTIEDGVVSLIRTANFTNVFDMLEEFGKPDEIWIKAMDSGVPYAQYRIVFFYPQKGIMAAYDGTVPGSADETIIEICLTETLFEPFFPIWLWSPESNKTFRELEALDLLGALPGDFDYFVSLEESTDIDVDTFYEIYSGPSKKSTCFEAIDRTLVTPEPTP